MTLIEHFSLPLPDIDVSAHSVASDMGLMGRRGLRQYPLESIEAYTALYQDIGICVWDIHRYLVNVNAAFFAVTGLPDGVFCEGMDISDCEAALNHVCVNPVDVLPGDSYIGNDMWMASFPGDRNIVVSSCTLPCGSKVSVYQAA